MTQDKGRATSGLPIRGGQTDRQCSKEVREKMKARVSKIDVPIGSEISKRMVGAHYVDCYQVPAEIKGRSALQIWLNHVSKTPSWVNVLMAARNIIVSALGLKNLGHLGAVNTAKSTTEYQVGDRVGIFTLLSISDQEVILGDFDRHLDVKVSVYKDNRAIGSIVISTVVHTHNLFGKLYMLFVTPIHKLIVPTMLARDGLS